MPKISIQVDGKAEFDRVFKRLDANFSDLTSVWEAVKQEFWQIEKEQFDSQGASGAGGKWQSLADSTRAQKIRKYGRFEPILVASGRLKKSLTGQTSDTVLNVTKNSLEVGSRLPYSKYHQRGGKRLPQRKPISFSDRQKLRMQKRIQRELVRLMRSQNLPIE